MASQAPLQLEQAIKNAAEQYDPQQPGALADLLTGIWREESGSTYPNPAVNSSGYGGLFGTTDAFGSTQEQADLAGSILAEGLRQSGGNVAEALSYYNSGSLQGGYTSVPGETVFGTIAVPPAPSSAGLTPGPQQSGFGIATGSPGSQLGTQNVSLESQVTSVFTGGLEGALAFGPELLGKLGIGNPLSGTEKFFGNLLVRGLELLAGVALIGLGLVGIYVALSKQRSDIGALAAALKQSSGSSSKRSSSSSESERPLGERSRRAQRQAGFEPSDARQVRRQARRRANAARRRERAQGNPLDEPGGEIPY